MFKKGFSASLVFCLLLSLFQVAHAEQQIVINIPAFTLYLYEQGVQVKSYPIAIGTELNPSILGETTIINKVVDPTYYPSGGKPPILPGPDNPVGTRWLGLNWPGYGIHGTNNPKSIGSAASSGCIRMHNSAVEELANLVSINTPVRLIYQTVVIREEPLIQSKTITVYPDIYKQGVTPKQLEEELARTNWGTVHWSALLTLLRLPTGKPQPIPWSIDLFLEDQPLAISGVQWGELSYVPWDLPLDPRLDFASELVQWGDDLFLPLEQYLQLTGFGIEKTQGAWFFQRPMAYFEENPLGKALQYNNEVYLATDYPKFRLIPEEVKVLIHLGEVYYPASLFAENFDLVWP